VMPRNRPRSSTLAPTQSGKQTRRFFRHRSLVPIAQN
jgi:hypothetical protein